MRDLESILVDFRLTRSNVEEEARQRAAITSSDEYTTLQRTIENAQKEQAELLAKIPNSQEEYDMDKQELMQAMKELGMKTAGEFRAKTRTIRTVDVRAVMEAMQGDIDNLMVVSSVKMKDLEDFAKANPEYKRDLRKCIKEEGFTITDIILNDE